MFTISFFSNPWAEKSDESLVLATKNGDSSAFEALYERRNKKIYNYLWNLLNYNKDDTLSVTSDAFIKFYQYIKTRDIDNVKSVLYRIAHNTAIDRMRTNQSQYEQAFDEKKLEQVPDFDADKKSVNILFQQELFQSLLLRLDGQQREILYLYYQEEKSYDEIATIL